VIGRTIIIIALALFAGCAAPDVPASRRPAFEARALLLQGGAPAWIVAVDETDQRVVLRSDDGGQRWRRFESPGDLDGATPDVGASADLAVTERSCLCAQSADATYELAPVFDPHESRPTQWVLWRRRGMKAVPLATIPDDVRN
jgi:hypothetical protein